MKSESPNFLQVILSVIAALFGVQSESARERDFAHGRHPALYIVVALVMVALLIAGLLMVVRVVLS